MFVSDITQFGLAYTQTYRQYAGVGGSFLSETSTKQYRNLNIKHNKITFCRPLLQYNFSVILLERLYL